MSQFPNKVQHTRKLAPLAPDSHQWERLCFLWYVECPSTPVRFPNCHLESQKQVGWGISRIDKLTFLCIVHTRPYKHSIATSPMLNSKQLTTKLALPIFEDWWNSKTRQDSHRWDGVPPLVCGVPLPQDRWVHLFTSSRCTMYIRDLANEALPQLTGLTTKLALPIFEDFLTRQV